MAVEIVRLDERQLAQLLKAVGDLTASVDRLVAVNTRLTKMPQPVRKPDYSVHQGDAGPDVPTPRQYRDKPASR